MPDFSGPPLFTKPLGPLEWRVMEILWRHGGGTPQYVRERLGTDSAYTTVMTTLKRLYTKGWANRHLVSRAYQYTPRVTRRDWDVACVERFIGEYLADQRQFPMLISMLVDAASANPQLLDELERKVAVRRVEMRGQASEDRK
jgi:predicted transcriptional regulator